MAFRKKTAAPPVEPAKPRTLFEKIWDAHSSTARTTAPA